MVIDFDMDLYSKKLKLEAAVDAGPDSILPL